MTDIFYGTRGPRDAKIMIVGEAWSTSDAMKAKPFQSPAGFELEKMLRETGIVPETCFMTQVVPARPANDELWRMFSLEKSPTEPAIRGLRPDATVRAGLTTLEQQIAAVKPDLIIAAGNYAFWALSNDARTPVSRDAEGRRVPTGIGDFRGSMLYTRPELGRICVLPIIHPDSILKSWDLRAQTVHDLRTRVPKALHKDWEPAVKPTINYRPTYSEMFSFLTNILTQLNGGRIIKLANDIETRQYIMTCMCFATSSKYAIVLPFIDKVGDNITSYWNSKQEVVLTRLMCQVLTHPNVRLIGQNYIYDMTYIHRFYGITPNCYHDTLSAQHLIWPGTQKDLGYLSSIYCHYHRYWKDDNKEWDAKMDINSHFKYNGEDGVRTFEIHENQLSVIKQQGLDALWLDEMDKHLMAFEMSTYGMKIDMNMKAQLAFELSYASQERVATLLKIVPQSLIDEFNGGPTFRKKVGQAKQQVLWPVSSAQQKVLFYDILDMAGQRHRKTKNPTLDKEAIPKLKARYPWASRIFDLLLELRSIDVFASTFVNARVDSDARMRTSFNPAGTETFRWSSSQNPFDTGCNFQNLPKGKDL